MATDVARLSLQIDVTGAKRAQQAMAAVQSGSTKLTQVTNQQSIALTGLRGRLNTVRQGFRLQKGAVQQAGYQIGDFAVQVGAGQSALVAFSQQASQLAGVMGPGGAVLGAVIAIGAAIAIPLVRSMGAGEEAAKSFTERLGELRDATDELTDAQVRQLRLEFKSANRDRQKQITAEKERIAELREEQQRYQDLIDDPGARMRQSRATGITVTASELRERLKELDGQIDTSRANIHTYMLAADDAAQELDELIEGTDKTGDSAEKAAEKIREMVEAAEQQAATIGLSARATATYEAALAGANAEQILAIDQAYARVEAHKAEVEQQKRLQEQYKITAANDPLLQRQAAGSRGQDIIANLREEAEATRRSLDERYAAQKEYKRKVMQINDMMRLGVIENEQQKNALLAQARRQHLEQMTAIDGGYWERWMQASRENLENFSQLSQSVIGNFTSGFGDAFEAIVLDTKDAESAFKELGVSMVRSVVNAIGQMIAQWIALQAVQLALGSTATAATVTQAGTAAAAWAPAAALASLATGGANAAPAAAALTSTTALSQTLALAGGPSFEGGGYTGSGSRSGGVDGKGGFPAILHPNETVIDHELGQRANNTSNVNQTIVMNVSGDVTAQTRQEIMKAMPMIRQQAKSVVLSESQNGGAMSRAMGRRS